MAVLLLVIARADVELGCVRLLLWAVFEAVVVLGMGLASCFGVG